MTNIQRLNDVGKVEQDPFGRRHGIKHGAQQMPAPTSDVGDRVKATEVIGGEDGGGVSGRLARHRLAEDPAYLGMAHEVGPETVAGDQLDGGRTRPDRVLESVKRSQDDR